MGESTRGRAGRCKKKLYDQEWGKTVKRDTSLRIEGYGRSAWRTGADLKLQRLAWKGRKIV